VDVGFDILLMELQHVLMDIITDNETLCSK